MSITYNAYEVFEIADKVEVAGESFYRSAASKLEDGCDVKKLLLELADMEVAHQSYFSAMRDRYNVEDVEGLIDLEGQAGSYLKAIGEAHVIHNLANILDESEDDAEKILKIALEFEKDSVVYFAALKSAVVDVDEQGKIDRIVQEEVEHVGILTRKLRELQG